MGGIKVGYARVSSHAALDRIRQLQALQRAGVTSEHIWTDVGLAGRPRELSGRDAALASLRDLDRPVLVTTSWARLARSQGDLLSVLDRLIDARSALIIYGQRHPRPSLIHLQQAL